MKRALSLIGVFALVWGVGAGTAHAICNAFAACPNLVAISACCGATACTLDGTVTVTGGTSAAPCVLDFGTRDVTVSGTLNAGVSLDVRAGSVHVTGKIASTGTPGGDVTIEPSSAGPLNFVTVDGSGQIDVSGTGSAGSLTILSDGPVSLTGGASSSIRAVGLDLNSDGGNIDIESSKDAITIGIPVLANSGQNGSDGAMSISAKKGIALTSKAEIGVDGFNPATDITAGGPITVADGADIHSNGPGGSGDQGGDITITGASIDVHGSIETRGGTALSLDGIGGDGGSIQMVTTDGPIAITRTFGVAMLVDGALGGDAGSIELTNDDSLIDGDVTIAGTLSAQGAGTANRQGSGGSVIFNVGRTFTLGASKRIDVSAVAGSAGEVDITTSSGDVVLNGRLNGVSSVQGGTVTIDSKRNVTFNEKVLMGGTSTQPTAGGAIDPVTARGKIVVAPSAILDVSGTITEPGGSINLAGQSLSISAGANLNADGGNSTGATGGRIQLRAGIRFDSNEDAHEDATGKAQIDGQVTANGKNPSGAGGSITIEGCDVLISQGATVDSTGDATSTNRLIVRKSLTVNGKLKATANNQATLPPGTSPVTTGGQVVPGFAQVTLPACVGRDDPAGCLTPCTCGDGVVQAWEDCDAGNGDRCAGHCDPSCQAENCPTAPKCVTGICSADFGCQTESKPDDTPCPDGNVCNGDEQCSSGVCQPVPDTAPNCDDHNPCTNDCDPVVGCKHTAVASGTNCDDGNACNGTETCSGVDCTPGPPPSCADADPDTRDFCDPAKNPICQNVLTPCTIDLDCTDGNPCTDDKCLPGAQGGKFCHNPPIAAPGTGVAGCDDNDPCNGAEACVDGACQPGLPKICAPDGKVCTSDACQPGVGCTYRAIAGCCEGPGDPVCNDTNVCTTDGCVDNACTHENRPDCCTTDQDCDDGNVCTADHCNTGTNTCVHDAANEGQNCGDACFTGRVCQNKVCLDGNEIPCPADTSACTDDYCDPILGCVHPAIPGCCDVDGDCNDANACTADTCQDSRCLHGLIDPNCQPCVTDTDCGGSGGRCAGETCASGVCTAVAPFACAAGTTCRLDDNAQPFCVCTSNAGCDDHNACNGLETCRTELGTCSPGTAPNCDDGNVCTDDSCDPAQGCMHSGAASFASVAAHLRAVTQAVGGAAAAELATPLRKAIGTKTSALQAKVNAASDAAGASAKKEGRLLKKASAALKKLAATIAKGQKGKKPKIAATLAATLKARLDCAASALAGLQRAATG